MAKSNKNHYETLGLATDATLEQVKSVYRKLARKYHPDVNQGNLLAEEKFKDVTTAYEVLSDEKKKRQYDLMNGFNINFHTRSSRSKQAHAKKEYKKHEDQNTTKKKTTTKTSPVGDKEFNTVFAEFLDGLFHPSQGAPTPSSASSGKANTKKAKPKKGSDITVDVELTMEESLNGTVRKVNVLHTLTCPKCKGVKVVNGNKCQFCKGSGETSKHNKISVQIPQGVKQSSKVRIQGEGNKGLDGGLNGDLYLVINIKGNQNFEYDGLNVLSNIPITVYEAALGSSIEIPTIDGIVTMRIPPETSSGQKFKLAGQGLKAKGSKKRGDHIATVEIVIPKKLNKQEKELFLKLKELRGYNPRESMLK